MRALNSLPRSMAAFAAGACGIDLDRRAIGEKMQIDRHRAVFVGFHQPVAPVVALAWRVTNSSTPRTLLSRGSHFGIDAAQVLNDSCGSLWQVLQDDPLGACLLPQLLRLVDRPHAGIFDRIEIVALLDRSRTLVRIVELGLEYGAGDFSVFRKATMSLIS